MNSKNIQVNKHISTHNITIIACDNVIIKMIRICYICNFELKFSKFFILKPKHLYNFQQIFETTNGKL